MDSMTLYTEEIDDLHEAAGDLLAQAKSFSFKKNSLAILFMEEETDYLQLYALLSEQWHFPVIGCTVLSSFSGKEGYCDMGISLLLLTGDDCSFSVGVTGELDRDNYRSELAACYGALREALTERERFIISFGGMVTNEKSVAGDDLVTAISELSGGIPVFGGSASDGFTSKNIRACCNGRITANGQVLALVSGNVHPHFVCVSAINDKSSITYEVTESRKNQLLRLGSERFLDVLRKENFVSEKTDVLSDYILSPFIVSIQKEDGDCIEVARSLSTLDHTSGSGFFLGAVPEGSIVRIGVIGRSDVQDSVAMAIDGILQKLRDGGADCHTMFCISCCARFLALAGNKTAEVDAVRDRLPPSLSLIGMYSYGEYCPVTGSVTGALYNMFHNFTFTILAF